MSDFISDEDMEKMEQESAASAKAPDFIPDEEVEQLATSEPKSALQKTGETLATGAGTAIGTEAARRLAESGIVGDKLASGAEGLAYKAIGGESTPAGKKFLRDQAADFSNSSLFTEKDLGRKVLNEGMLGKLGLAGSDTMFDQAQVLSDQANQNLGSFTNNVSRAIGPVPIQPAYQKFQADVLPTLSQFEDADLINDITGPGAQPFMGKEATVEEMELAKRRTIPKNMDYQRQDPILKQKRRMYKEASEDAINKLNPRLLDEFKALKKESGENATIQKLLMDKSVRDAVSGDIDLNLKDIVTAGTLSPATAAGLKAAQRKGAGVGAKSLDALSGLADKAKLLAQSKIGKALPGVLGAGAAMLSATEAANAGELSPGEAVAAGALETINPIPFTDTIGAAVQAKKAYNETESPLKALGAGAKGFIAPAVDLIDKPGLERSANARQMMSDRYEKLDQFLGKRKPEPAKDFKNLVEQRPEQLQNLAEAFKSLKGTEAFVAPLEKAAKADSEADKQAELFGIYQQPAFRQLLNKGKKPI